MTEQMMIEEMMWKQLHFVELWFRKQVIEYEMMNLYHFLIPIEFFLFFPY